MHHDYSVYVSCTVQYSNTISTSLQLFLSDVASPWDRLLRPLRTSSDCLLFQASEISTKFAADKSEYYSTLTTETGFPSAYSVIGAAIPDSARPLAAANPELFLASLVKASSQPDWFTSMPTPVQDFWESAGSHYIEMYTSEVDAARPIPSSLSSSLSSASSRLSSMSAALSSSSAAVSASASAAVLHGAAPASPILEQMTFVAAGVAIAAGLVGMAML